MGFLILQNHRAAQTTCKTTAGRPLDMPVPGPFPSEVIGYDRLLLRHLKQRQQAPQHRAPPLQPTFTAQQLTFGQPESIGRTLHERTQRRRAPVLSRSASDTVMILHSSGNTAPVAGRAAWRSPALRQSSSAIQLVAERLQLIDAVLGFKRPPPPDEGLLLAHRRSEKAMGATLSSAAKRPLPTPSTVRQSLGRPPRVLSPGVSHVVGTVPLVTALANRTYVDRLVGGSDVPATGMPAGPLAGATTRVPAETEMCWLRRVGQLLDGVHAENEAVEELLEHLAGLGEMAAAAADLDGQHGAPAASPSNARVERARVSALAASVAGRLSRENAEMRALLAQHRRHVEVTSELVLDDQCHVGEADPERPDRRVRGPWHASLRGLSEVHLNELAVWRASTSSLHEIYNELHGRADAMQAQLEQMAKEFDALDPFNLEEPPRAVRPDLKEEPEAARV